LLFFGKIQNQRHLKNPTPKIFSFHFQDPKMLTHGHEIWSQALVSDLLKREKENTAKCSHFLCESTESTPLHPDGKKGNLFHAQGTFLVVCHFWDNGLHMSLQVAGRWKYTFPPLLGTEKSKSAFAFSSKPGAAAVNLKSVGWLACGPLSFLTLAQCYPPAQGVGLGMMGQMSLFCYKCYLKCGLTWDISFA
jgi:hypothetical protein